ncbi:hypothetical protein [Streptomyces sp. NPDC059916]|uniref:hypothetical protein n=1 Tax=Streptomyces sp. NPDC059916 TaxID=3347001 RepID=UPI0036C5801C
MADRHVTPFNDPSHQATYRHRDVVAIRRRERARIRREKGIRWGGRPHLRCLKNPANLIRPQS